jgi:hypothetical protein
VYEWQQDYVAGLSGLSQRDRTKGILAGNSDTFNMVTGNATGTPFGGIRFADVTSSCVFTSCTPGDCPSSTAIGDSSDHSEQFNCIGVKQSEKVRNQQVVTVANQMKVLGQSGIQYVELAIKNVHFASKESTIVGVSANQLGQAYANQQTVLKYQPAADWSISEQNNIFESNPDFQDMVQWNNWLLGVGKCKIQGTRLDLDATSTLHNHDSLDITTFPTQQGVCGKDIPFSIHDTDACYCPAGNLQNFTDSQVCYPQSITMSNQNNLWVSGCGDAFNFWQSNDNSKSCYCTGKDTAAKNGQCVATVDIAQLSDCSKTNYKSVGVTSDSIWLAPYEVDSQSKLFLRGFSGDQNAIDSTNSSDKVSLGHLQEFVVDITALMNDPNPSPPGKNRLLDEIDEETDDGFDLSLHPSPPSLSASSRRLTGTQKAWSSLVAVGQHIVVVPYEAHYVLKFHVGCKDFGCWSKVNGVHTWDSPQSGNSSQDSNGFQAVAMVPEDRAADSKWLAAVAIRGHVFACPASGGRFLHVHGDEARSTTFTVNDGNMQYGAAASINTFLVCAPSSESDSGITVVNPCFQTGSCPGATSPQVYRLSPSSSHPLGQGALRIKSMHHYPEAGNTDSARMLAVVETPAAPYHEIRAFSVKFNLTQSTTSSAGRRLSGCTHDMNRCLVMDIHGTYVLNDGCQARAGEAGCDSGYEFVSDSANCHRWQWVRRVLIPLL